jgi:type III secretion protein T
MAMMRPLGAMILVPAFSASTLGGSLARNALALVATIPILPLLATMTIPSPMASSGAYILLLARELGIGVMLGFSAAIPFWAVDAAGFALDPLIGGQSSPLGALFSHLTIVMFFLLGGFHALLHALYTSYVQLPPGGGWLWHTQFVPFLSNEWQTLYTLALGFAMPAMVMIVLVDLALGLINRSVSQLNVFLLSMPIKSAVTVLMLIIGMQFGFAGITDRLAHFDGGIVRMLVPGR